MFLRNINYLYNKSLEHRNILWTGAKACRKVVVGTGIELIYLITSSLTLRPDFPHFPRSNPLGHFTLTSPASSHLLSCASHHWAMQSETSITSLSRRRGNFMLLVGVLLPAFLLFCAWMLSKTASPHSSTPWDSRAMEKQTFVWDLAGLQSRLPQGNGSRNKGVPTNRWVLWGCARKFWFPNKIVRWNSGSLKILGTFIVSLWAQSEFQ